MKISNDGKISRKLLEVQLFGGLIARALWREAKHSAWHMRPQMAIRLFMLPDMPAAPDLPYCLARCHGACDANTVKGVFGVLVYHDFPPAAGR